MSPATPVELVQRGGDLSYREARQSPCLSCHVAMLQSPAARHHRAHDLDGHRPRRLPPQLRRHRGGARLARGLGPGVSAPVVPLLGGGERTLYRPLDAASAGGLRQLQLSFVRLSPGHDDGSASKHPLLDRHRMVWFAGRVVFDENRRVVERPDWEEMLEAFGSMPTQRVMAPPPEPDPVIEDWRSVVLSKKGADSDVRPLRHYADPEVSDPCTGCEAWCCKTLVFNRGRPGNAAPARFPALFSDFPGWRLAWPPTPGR